MTGPHPDRLFPPEPDVRRLARQVYEAVASLPVVSVHGHIDAALLDLDPTLGDATALLITPDHYVTRMLHSQGVALDSLGVTDRAIVDGHRSGGNDRPTSMMGRDAWRLLCRHWPALRGTGSQVWLTYTLSDLFGIHAPLTEAIADRTYDRITEQLAEPQMRPRALFERFGIEVLATTDGALDDLAHHRSLGQPGALPGAVLPTFRPDSVIDPDHPQFVADVGRLLESGTAGATTYEGYLDALTARRQAFIEHGAVATDHGPATADTEVLTRSEARALFARVVSGRADPSERRRFCAHMLVVMAEQSCEDGLVMQLHAGVRRDHDGSAAARFGRDVGADFPVAVGFTDPLRPLLERCGNSAGFRLVVYTVDETSWSRELAPLASYYPALRLGPPWWFLDAPEAMGRFFAATVESAGYANFSGFIDDARGLCSIPARHDMARRCVAAHLARQVATHRVSLEDACELARDFVYDRPKSTFGV